MPRYDQCDETCTTDCGHCKGSGHPLGRLSRNGVTLQPDRTITWRTVTDNHPVPRGYAEGTGDWYDMVDGDDRPPTIVLRDVAELKDAFKAVYLVDTGISVTTWYVAGYHRQRGHVYLHPFPLSVGVRRDNGRPIDMRDWIHGPSRCYHLKINER